MPTQNKTLQVTWEKQGIIHWEYWWVQRHGEVLERIPGLKDHISFANYDLQRNKCPRMVLGTNALEIRDVPDDKLAVVGQILDYHGFRIISSS